MCELPDADAEIEPVPTAGGGHKPALVDGQGVRADV
jgi:hypothetical protein